ncbi:MAG TPA: hypothetical protein VMC82_05900 [Thermoplasmata archaeon]|nr:hypothetical protein [Thermoplasmata archaeon]
MTQVLEDLAELPLGSHALSLHADADEAEDHAIRFLSGTPEGGTAIYFVNDERTSAEYNARLADVSPGHVGCVVALGHEQVELVDGKLRPAREVQEFFADHQDGVTAGGDTLSMYWTSTNVPEHLEYEQWFDQQPRVDSRFVCPYDLRKVPSDQATEILAELGRHHSHVVLSSSPEPAIRLLQLFVFETAGDLPRQLAANLRWAVEQGYVHPSGPLDPLQLTPTGLALVHEWGDRTTVDW